MIDHTFWHFHRAWNRRGENEVVFSAKLVYLHRRIFRIMGRSPSSETARSPVKLVLVRGVTPLLDVSVLRAG